GTMKKRMNRHKEERLMNSIAITIVLILFFILIIFFSGCSKKIYVPVEKIKTEYISKNQIDTLYLRDSIFYSYIEKGDTVYILIEKNKYLYKNKILLDTIFRTDTIRVTRINTITIEKQMKWYDKIPLILGWMLIGGGVLWLFFKIKKIFKK
ncbi:MAG: hypothetical protein FWD66_10085, partial [Paludibacter sp.]|nr:hypothetical protein [Paludibacter sp.]